MTAFIVVLTLGYLLGAITFSLLSANDPEDKDD
jgi:glycerol-3-phosphate acyltransferase PlsY